MMVNWLLAGLIGAASPVPSPTLPPLIYHAVVRPLCSSLQTRIKPALGLMIRNDATIDKSLPLFQEYISRVAEGSDAGRDIAILHMESLVQPLVDNTLAVQKFLEDPSVFPQIPRNDDDKKLIEIKTEMLKTLAAQAAALDIINGFVTTQQMSEMQHEGWGWLESTSGQGPNGQSNGAVNDLIGPTPDPLMRPQTFDDMAIQAGVAENQYQIDPTTIPGLAVGYNQVSKLKDGVVWTQDLEKKIERPLVAAVIAAANSCMPPQTPAVSPSPKP